MGMISCQKDEVLFNPDPNAELELPMILKINGQQCFFSADQNALRFSISKDSIINYEAFIEFQEYSDISFNDQELHNKVINKLGNIFINKEYEIQVKTNGEVKKLKLTFTNLPIVQVITNSSVYNEPKTLARFNIQYPNSELKSFTSYIGIEYRGASSQFYDKKSYGFSFLKEPYLSSKTSKSVFAWKKNTDWILDAMYIDPARLRNKTSFEIWKSFEGENHEGINAEFVELYINNEHHGLYCLNQNVNAELLKLIHPEAVLYKAVEWENGATNFETYSEDISTNYYWDGWEQKHPNPRAGINWHPLNQLRKLVVQADDEKFLAEIGEKLDINNLIDYYIFLNLVSAIDNTGKNTFLSLENPSEPMTIIPWDIDGSWGIIYNGTEMGHTSILKNNLYKRLLQLNENSFKSNLKDRWFYLRNNSLKESRLLSVFQNHFNDIGKSGIMQIENEKWDLEIDIQAEQVYLEEWLYKRLEFLDDYFKELSTK